MGILSILFSFNGRIGRGPFWLGNLLLFVVSMLFLIVAGFGVGSLIRSGEEVTEESIGRLIQAVVPYLGAWMVVGTFIFVGQLAIGIKRLHDRDKSGLWLFAFHGPSLLAAGSWFLGGGPGVGFGLVFSVINLVAVVWYLVELGFLPGSDGENRYGPPPGSSAGFEAAEAASAERFRSADEAIAAAAAARAAAASRPAVVAAAGAKPRPATPSGFGRRGLSTR
jgi:uncharacterized membrane protein YhaH (DUF805 family)